MLRQNRSEGSSTSRSFAKTALLRTRRKTFQFSDEQFARHIFFTEPLFLIPSVQTEVQESGPTRGAILFRRNHFSSCRPAEPVRLEAARGGRVRKGTAALFEGTTRRESLHFFLREPLFLLPSGRDCPQKEARTLCSQGTGALFSREPLFLVPFCSRTPVGPRLSPAVLSLALHCKEVAEFRQYRKRARRCSDIFRQHPDTVLAKVPKEMAPLGEMPNP